nr:RNA-directed DNA polymerase, eukaryota [Tanacetum cinerariifolium]
MLIVVYAPHDSRAKHMLWDYLQNEILKWKGEVVVMGDFNEVRFKSDCFGSVFNAHEANVFNSFIANSNLVEVNLGGCSYTWCHKSTTKMSKLDRFLISDSLMNSCPNINAISLERLHSDHRPILLRESHLDYGPIPFKVFHYWFDVDSFNKTVEDAWKEYPGKKSNAIRYLMGKLKYLKGKIQEWNGVSRSKVGLVKTQYKKELEDIDEIIDRKKVDEEVIGIRVDITNNNHDIDNIQSMEMAQKAKVRRANEGDEILDFFMACSISDERLKGRSGSAGRTKLRVLMVLPLVFSPILDLIKSGVFDAVRSSRGSILVNGSPTEEFQFGKVDAGRFHGIKMGGGSVNFSHMFYADDAVFIGQWCESNITTLVHILECFHKGSGLRINMCKRKIMGVHVDGDMVKNAAKKLGCLVLKTPLSYLGSIVGGSMHRRQSWIDIVDKVKKRLSKWKLQSLSIGGRSTLVKAVLGTIPIFNFSIFKVSRGVLRELEGIRRQFFNGHEPNSKKVNWVSWEKVLLAKERGGLGVSSLFAMNRGLLFKWIWKFRTQGNSLWARIIKAIHGVDGCVGVNSMVRKPSFWMSIIKEMDVLKTKGIDLMKHMRIKVGNGESTSFWEDKWCDAGVFKDRYPRAFALENCKSIKVAAKLSQPEFSHSFRRLPRGGCEQNQVNELEDLMRLVVLSLIEDRWMWGLENSGKCPRLESYDGLIAHQVQYLAPRVPSKVLQVLESIRGQFFNGHDMGSNKATWVKWNSVLTDKNHGGLGVSSLYALNRGLILKWVWKFLTQKESLWMKIITAIHGVNGNLYSECKMGGRSCWLSIVNEIRVLQIKGVDIFEFLKQRLGNGDMIKFWLDNWYEGGILKNILPRLYALENEKEVTVSSKLNDLNLECSFRRTVRGVGVELGEFG